MKNKSLATLFASTSSVAMLLLGASPVAAQDATAEDEQVGVEEIIVTAQKREENLQDTPISIVALNSDTLDQKGISSMNDLFTGSVPSLRIVPFVGRASAVSIGMRGMVPVDATQVTRDPTVGIYLDGVYLGRVQGLGMELADLERIEVLRGPQGTLFGRNTVGGAVSIVSKKPTGELGFDLKAGIGNRGGRTYAAHINLPEAAHLSFKISAVYDARDGWVKNTLKESDVPANYTIGGRNYTFEDINSDWSQVQRYGFRIASQFKPADNLSFLYAFDWSRDKSTGAYAFLTQSTQQIVPAVFAARDTNGRGSVSRAGGPLLPSFAKTSGHSFTAEWEISDALTLKTISGWRNLNGTQWDQDVGSNSRWNTAAQGRLAFAQVIQKQQSHELQLIGNVGDLKFVAGAYYFKENGRDQATTFRTLTLNGAGTALTFRNPATTSNPVINGVSNLTPDRASVADIKSKALFAQATWSPGETGLHITVGGRYTDDRKSGRLTALTGAPNVFPGGTAPRNVPPFLFESSRFDPMATIAYDFSDDINVYVKYGQAYRAGGANTRSATLRTFGEEELKSYEAGVKADLFDRRARINLAAFTSRLSALQVDFNNPQNISVTETVNVPGKTKVKGIELDVTVVPTRGLTLGANYAYTTYNQRAVRNPFPTLAGTFNTELLNILNTPKHAFSATLDYDLGETAIGVPRFHLDADNVGGFYSSAVPSIDDTLEPREWIINGRLSLAEIPGLGKNFEIALWGKNLTNATYAILEAKIPVGVVVPITVDPTGGARNYVSAYNDPRSYGLEVRMRF